MSVDVVVDDRVVACGQDDLPTIVTIECWRGPAWLSRLRAILPLSVRNTSDRALVAFRRAIHESDAVAQAIVMGHTALVFGVSQRVAKETWSTVWRSECPSIAEARLRLSSATPGSLYASLQTRMEDSEEGDILLATQVAQGRVESPESRSGAARYWVCTAQLRLTPAGRRIEEFGFSGLGHRRIENCGWKFNGEAWSVDLHFRSGGGSTIRSKPEAPPAHSPRP